MGTRANIIIKDDHDKLYFYRHNDGYPDHTGKDLKEFVKGYTDGNMRGNVLQSAGWLIVRGHEEYKSFGKDWNVGAYEPTTDIHGDIEYLYIIDIAKSKLITSKVSFSGKQTIIDTYDF